MKKIFPIVVLTILCATFSAFGQAAYNVGDTIYVNAYYAGCVKATVKQTDPKYYVHIEEGNYKDKDVFYSAGRVSECPQKAAEPKNNQPTENQAEAAVPKQEQSQNDGDLEVGDRIDVYLSGNEEGKNRGTIVEISGGQIKVHYDGCSEKSDVWENAALARPEASISADAPEIKFLVGKWLMFTPSYPTTVVRGNDIYREYGTGAKTPPLVINADGAYVWYFDYGKPPVKGKWMTHAKIEGARYGTETENGIIIEDPQGGEWKVYRRKSTLDNEDHITIRTMCSGQTIMGTRIR